MRICRHCGVKIENDVRYCPLCDMETLKTDDEFAEDYPYVKSRFNRGFIIKMLTFLAVVFVGVSFLIDHLVPTGNPWAFITAGAVIYVWVSAIGVLKSAPNPASIILAQMFSSSALVTLIDYFTGWHKWSLNFVIPGLIMAAALALTLMILIKPVKFRAYTVYQLVIAILGVLSVLLWLFGFSDIEWPVVSSAVVSALCFLTMLVFSHRRTRNELYKRFHV